MLGIDVKDIWKNFLEDRGNWRPGFFAGIMLTLSILWILGSQEVQIPLRWRSNSWEVSSSGLVLCFPSYNNCSDFSVTLSNPSGECITVDLKKGNGQTINGYYCEGDRIIFDNSILEMTKIRADSQLDKPVTITRYKNFNLGGLIPYLILAFALIAIVDKINQIKQKKYNKEIVDKRKKVQEKLNLSEEDYDNLMEVLEKDIEFQY